MSSYQNRNTETEQMINDLLREAGFKVRYKENGVMENKKEIGALWEKQSKGGKKYYSGTLNGQRIVAFLTGNKDPKPQIKIYQDTDKEI